MALPPPSCASVKLKSHNLPTQQTLSKVALSARLVKRTNLRLGQQDLWKYTWVVANSHQDWQLQLIPMRSFALLNKLTRTMAVSLILLL
jgi:hypothetical protein